MKTEKEPYTKTFELFDRMSIHLAFSRSKPRCWYYHRRGSQDYPGGDKVTSYISLARLHSVDTVLGGYEMIFGPFLVVVGWV